jgi:hypothetical protein
MASITLTTAVLESANTRKIAKNALYKLETKHALWQEAVSLLNVANKAIRCHEYKMATFEIDEYGECTAGDQLLSELEAVGWHAYHNVDRANLMVFVAQKEFDEAKSKAKSATVFVKSVMAYEAEYYKSVN